MPAVRDVVHLPGSDLAHPLLALGIRLAGSTAAMLLWVFVGLLAGLCD